MGHAALQVKHIALILHKGCRKPKANRFINWAIKSKASSLPTPPLNSLLGFMSCFILKKPNHPAKRVWSRLASAVHKLRRSVLPVRPSGPRFHVEHGERRKGFQTRKLSHNRSFAPVYVDELFSRDVTVHVDIAPPKEEEKLAAQKMAKSEWTSVGSSSSRVIRDLGEVDLRAEMFIARFKEGMSLERQRSFGEYREMLARGV